MGERDQARISDGDVLSTINFDKTGKFLAVGDGGGRVIMFKYSEINGSRYFDYKYHTEIQAHEPDFDHLKSVEVSEKVNTLEFLHPSGNTEVRFLSTNDKRIKLW